jgi:hypothetical protein
MNCPKCKTSMTLISMIIPSGKDKEEKATFNYRCQECHTWKEVKTNLGDKGGMTTE